MRLLKEAGLSGGEKCLAGAALLLIALSAYYDFTAAQSTDKSWLLLAAGKWLAGGRMYTDIFEVNPPLIIWLYSLPAFIASALPEIEIYHILALLTFAVLALVLWLSARLIALHAAFKEKPGRQLFFILLLACSLTFCILPAYFSDRDYLFLVLTLPYVLDFCPGIAREEPPLRLKCLIGLLAAVGFCMKPHTAVVFILLQLLFIVRERSLAILKSPENLFIYMLGGLYIGSILLFMPEYWGTVLPMAYETYSAYSRKANGVYSIIVFIIIMGITFTDFRPRYQTPLRAGVYYFLGVCGACLLYGLVNNGWAYTYSPLLSYARILAGWVLLEFLWLKEQAKAKGEPADPFTFGMRSCGANLFLNGLFYLVCFIYFMVHSDCSSPSCRGKSSFFEQAERHPVHSFGTMSLEFYKWPVLAHDTGARWDTRFNSFWMLPKFVLSDPEFKERHIWIITYVGKAYAADLNNHRPDIIYVDSSPEIFLKHPNIDLPAYFSVVPEFKEAWSHYRRTDVIDACGPAAKTEAVNAAQKIDCRFDIYSRVPAS